MKSKKTINSDASRFLFWLGISFLIGLLAIVGFVYLIDPYGLYRQTTISGFNAIKPGLSHHHNEIKITQALSHHADRLILGNSRAEIGFDPENPAFAQNGKSTYNLAIPGSGIGTTRQQLQYLLEEGVRPKSLLIGIEFLDFLSNTPWTALSKVSDTPPKQELRPLFSQFWQFDVLFSLMAVKDAIRTLRIQHDHEAETMTTRGFNPLNEYLAYVRNDGYYAMFQQRAQENAKIYFKKSGRPFRQASVSDLRTILDLAAMSGADTRLVIYPYHAQIMLLFEETGLVPSFEAWKNLLVEAVKHAKQRYPDARLEVIDFSGFGYYNCERIPGKHEKAAVTQWYWEAGHFKKSLGDVILDSLYTGRVTYDPGSQFGMMLDESTLLTNKHRILKERRECEKHYPALFTEIPALVSSARMDLQKKKINSNNL